MINSFIIFGRDRGDINFLEIIFELKDSMNRNKNKYFAE